MDLSVKRKKFATLDKPIFPEYRKAILNKDDPELRRIPSFFGLDFGLMNANI